MKPEIAAAFAHAAKQLHHPPADAEAALRDWLELAMPKNIASQVLRRIIETFDGYIRVWHSSGVSGVVADGRLRAFLPTSYCFPGHTADMVAALERLDEWLADPACRVPGAVDFEALRLTPTASRGAR
jgi:hypothetical protein